MVARLKPRLPNTNEAGTGSPTLRSSHGEGLRIVAPALLRTWKPSSQVVASPPSPTVPSGCPACTIWPSVTVTSWR